MPVASSDSSLWPLILIWILQPGPLKSKLICCPHPHWSQYYDVLSISWKTVSVDTVPLALLALMSTRSRLLVRTMQYVYNPFQVPLVILLICIVCSQVAVDSPALSGSRYEFWHWHVLICRKLQDTCQACPAKEQNNIMRSNFLWHLIWVICQEWNHNQQHFVVAASWPKQQQARRLWFAGAANGPFPNNGHRLSLCSAFLGARATFSQFGDVRAIEISAKPRSQLILPHAAIMMHAVQLDIWYLIQKQLCLFCARVAAPSNAKFLKVALDPKTIQHADVLAICGGQVFKTWNTFGEGGCV